MLTYVIYLESDAFMLLARYLILCLLTGFSSYRFLLGNRSTAFDTVFQDLYLKTLPIGISMSFLHKASDNFALSQGALDSSLLPLRSNSSRYHIDGLAYRNNREACWSYICFMVADYDGYRGQACGFHLTRCNSSSRHTIIAPSTISSF